MGNREKPYHDKANTTLDEESQAQSDLDKIREIINSHALDIEAQKRKSEAREYVSDVLSEAINDRQQKDASVSLILSPIVEKAVSHTIANNRKQFTDYLYPLVGELVRKFANAFFRDFIDKTNELIENSVSFKSIAWRYKAWQTGVSFSRYVASQTYVFQTQQVLLIHKETGILLNSASLDSHHNKDSDLVSSMLTAISDFVSDSFGDINNESNQQLDEIKTRDFTLYLRQGPQANLVAAVSGNISPIAKNKLQTTLENIHNLYLPQLQNFKGDVSDFIPTYSLLNSCLLVEEKEDEKAKQKRPWLAIIFFTSILCLILYWTFLRWQTHSAVDAINNLPNNQGIVTSMVSVEGTQKITLKVFRDPYAMPVIEWLAQTNVDLKWISINEIPFVSPSALVLQRQIQKVLHTYPTVRYLANEHLIKGNLSVSDAMALKARLKPFTLTSNRPLEFDFSANEVSVNTRIAKQKLMNLLSGDITLLHIAFASDSAEIDASQSSKIEIIGEKYKQLDAVASELNVDVILLILGTSDNISNNQSNQLLSIQRANSTMNALLSVGISKQQMMTAGLSPIRNVPQDTNIRKAIIHVIYNPN